MCSDVHERPGISGELVSWELRTLGFPGVRRQGSFLGTGFFEEGSWPGTSVPARGRGQEGQGLRNGHAGGLGTVADFFLEDGGQHGTLGVTCAWVPAHRAAVEGCGRWVAGA